MDTLGRLASMRDEFIENPGTDPDYDGIVDEIGERNEGTGELNARWFDHVIGRFREISAGGSVTVHRRISVPDVEAFLDTATERALGCSWSWDEECASCDYHPEANHEHEILLTAQAPLGSVCWSDCMVQNFGHPHEREIVIEGPVDDVRVTLDGREVARLGRATA